MKLLRLNWSMLVVAFSAFGTGYVTNSLVRTPPLNSTDLASWVQAVGSIVAICAAIFISNMEGRRENRRRDQEMRQLVDGIEVMATNINSIVQSLQPNFAISIPGIIDNSQKLPDVRMYADILASVDFKTISYPLLVVHVLDLRRDVERLAEFIHGGGGYGIRSALRIGGTSLKSLQRDFAVRHKLISTTIDLIRNSLK